jgi:hypothetical protein
VPLAHNRPFDAVAADFLKAGLILDQVNTEAHTDLADGVVVRSDPPEGTIVRGGTKETIVVSHRPTLPCTANPILCTHVVIGNTTRIDQNKLITDLKGSQLLPQNFIAIKPK